MNNILKTDFFPDINEPERQSTKFKNGCFHEVAIVTDHHYIGMGWEYGILKPMIKEHGGIGCGGVYV